MRASRRSWCVAIVIVVTVAACAHKRTQNNGDGGPCTDGVKRCEGNTFEICNSGTWTTIDQCPLFCTMDGCKSCADGNCMTDTCASAAADHSYTGCEYWAVDLDNATEVFGKPETALPMNMWCSLWLASKQLTFPLRICYDGSWATAGNCNAPDDSCPMGFTCVDSPGPMLPQGVCGYDARHAPYAIVLSNPAAVPVAVTVENSGGMSMSYMINPNEVRTIFPQADGFPDQTMDGTQQAKAAYKVTSNSPVVAYQFNPLNNVDVFSNDASLLLPRTAFDQKYHAVSYQTLTRRGPTTAGRDDYHGYITIVAWQDGTDVEVTPTANTVKGRDGTPALLAGQPHTFTLNAFEVLSLQAVAGPEPFSMNGLNGGDLTGSLIRSPSGKSFGVWGGHQAVLIPTAGGGMCCADHLEAMLFPTSTWGKQFEVARTLPRPASNGPDLLRIVAKDPGTSLIITPGSVSGPCPVLTAGQFCEIQINENTEVIATNPVMVAHLMTSTIMNQTGTGDPSLSIVPPVEQHRTNYKFLVPMDYDKQYVAIVAIDTDIVLLDDQPVTTGWTPFGANRHVATPEVQPGAHTVSCPAKCSVEVYGWSIAVSYMVPGGLDLHQIVIE
jgi:hypothetical protein